MTCDQAADLLGPYAGDDLPTEARRRIEKHLLGCQRCAWEVQTLGIARARLRGDAGDEVMAPDAFRARTLARLLADNPHLSAPPPSADGEPAQYRLPIPLNR